ncbi:hypothetical protein C5B96_09595 [Subtercola sp. Z020]|uniref:hypothetical protein n=1 Tax=Subtercola sp. Z020 TaxID=2080582 RepID=UPI000CE869DC|nr:hypothetical protein [Subtercola sp. Z020]PPF82197.1 hypothetical protein C5B96_09595 [Subtercola sp. Z020]
MDEKPRFSRRTLLKAAAIAVPVAGIAIAVPTALTRRPDVAMWWTSLSQNGSSSRASLNVRIPAGVPSAAGASIFVNAASFPVYAVKSVTANDPWRPFFAKDAPFQLLTADRTAEERTALVVVDFVRMSSDESAGTVRATCNGADGNLLAEASLNLAQPLFTRFS